MKKTKSTHPDPAFSLDAEKIGSTYNQKRPRVPMRSGIGLCGGPLFLWYPQRLLRVCGSRKPYVTIQFHQNML
jgi:hypothetical protein